jgi:hypothetical protein
MTTVCAALSSWLRRNDRLVYYVRPVSLVNAAYRVMRQAYMSASANGALPANPRQIMYVARPEIFKISGKGFEDSPVLFQV